MTSSRRPSSQPSVLPARPALPAKAARARLGRVVALAAAVAAGVVLVGCGSATAGTNGSGSAANAAPRSGASGSSGAGAAGQVGNGTSQGSKLCARPDQPSRVLITRTGGVRIFEGQHGAQPAGTQPPVAGSRPIQFKTVTNPGLVHRLARALCGLPRMPRGPLPCPAQFPGSYQLYFMTGGLRLATVVVQESGCRQVTGLGPVRRAYSASFWRLLGRVLGSGAYLPPSGPPSSVQPGGPDLPGSGLVTGCEPTRDLRLRACPFHPGVIGKPRA